MSKAQIQTLKDNADTILSMREKIYRFIHKNPGCTNYEIETRLGIKETSVSGRLSDLQDEGLIYVSGNTKIGKSTYSNFKVSDPLRIETRKEQRLKKKFHKWFKSGKQYVDVMPDSMKLYFN